MYYTLQELHVIVGGEDPQIYYKKKKPPLNNTMLTIGWN
jgi:hypothetical protein